MKDDLVNRLRDPVRDSWDAEIMDNAADEIERLRKQRDELVEALESLYTSASHSAGCDDFHHSKKDQHAFDEPCPCVTRYFKALDKAKAALAKIEGEK